MKKAADVLRKTVNAYLAADMPVYAGFATLKITTAVFPLFMLIIALLNWLPGYSPRDFTNFLFSMIPDVPEVKALFTNVMSNLRSQSSGLLASVAALTSLWSSSAGVSSIQKGLGKLSPGGGSALKLKLVSVLFTLVLVVLIPALLLFNVLGDSLISLVRSATELFGLAAVTDQLVSLIRVTGVITAALSLLILLLIYTFLPGGRHSLRDQLPGAALTAVGWALFTWLFSTFMPIFWKSSIYGSLASLFLTLLWLEASINILFLGGALNAVLSERRTES